MTADRTQRLHRLERIYVRSPIYFVTTCTANRRHILAAEAIHESFVRFAKEGSEHGAWIGAYVLMPDVLMPDHLHAFVAIHDQQLSLSQWMKSLKNALSKTMRSNKIPTPRFQKTFFDHVLRSGESYTEKWHYVRENPVRAGLAKRSEDWPFQGEIFSLEYRSDS